MTFLVYSMVGDFALEDQPNWGKEYKTWGAALDAAREHHARMRFKHSDEPELYTIVAVDGEDASVLFHQDSLFIGDEAQAYADLMVGTWIRHNDRNADRIDGYDRDDLGESPDY